MKSLLEKAQKAAKNGKYNDAVAILKKISTSYSWNEMPEECKDILTNMAYQMGGKGLNKFKNMKKALKEKDYKKAAEEMRDSKWAKKQTHKRAERLAKRMEKVQPSSYKKDTKKK
jgi:lysozyme